MSREARWAPELLPSRGGLSSLEESRINIRQWPVGRELSPQGFVIKWG